MAAVNRGLAGSVCLSKVSVLFNVPTSEQRVESKTNI